MNFVGSLALRKVKEKKVMNNKKKKRDYYSTHIFFTLRARQKTILP